MHPKEIVCLSKRIIPLLGNDSSHPYSLPRSCSASKDPQDSHTPPLSRHHEPTRRTDAPAPSSHRSFLHRYTPTCLPTSSPLPTYDSVNRKARSGCIGSTASSRFSSLCTSPTAPEHAHTECDLENAAAAFPARRRPHRSDHLSLIQYSDCPDRREATCSIEDSEKNTFQETKDGDSGNQTRFLQASEEVRQQCTQLTTYPHSLCNPQ